MINELIQNSFIQTNKIYSFLIFPFFTYFYYSYSLIFLKNSSFEFSYMKLSRFLFSYDLNFATQNLFFVPFDENTANQCNICNFKPNNIQPNSSPNDVVITLSYGSLKNAALFIRTLRTTKSKASCVYIIEKDLYNSLHENLTDLLDKCKVQIITFDFPSSGIDFIKKNYCFHLAELFLRYNQVTIKRVIICDLYDVLFQGDPFHELLPKNQLHIVDEGFTYNGNDMIKRINRAWVEAFDPSFRFNSEQINYKYWCSGYIEGPILHMINILNLFCQTIAIDHKLHDQGCFNYLNLTGKLQKALIPVAPPNNNELFRHCSTKHIHKQEFPNVNAMYNQSLNAIALHHYYQSDTTFKISLLKACPRPDKSFNNYISRCDDKCIKSLEETILKQL